jgi:hypothetical protein
MALGRLWAGNVFGTSTGNLFVKLEGEDAALSGSLHFNESGVGLVVYRITGSFDGTRLTFTGETQAQIEGRTFGLLKAAATLGPRGDLHGEWETNIGSAGTFILFPHDRSQVPALGQESPEQLYTARHRFRAIEIDREQITALAETLQQEFTNGRVVVTVVTDTEQSRYLQDFNNLSFNVDQAKIIKIFVQEPDGGRGVNKVVSVEFGPQFNEALTDLRQCAPELERFWRLSN